MHILFTYGSLRGGHRNHYVLATTDPTFLGDDTITAALAGKWGDIPLIKEGEGSVPGEVYEISDYALSRLDYFEGTHSGLYERRTVTTSGGREAQVYFPGADLLKESR